LRVLSNYQAIRLETNGSAFSIKNDTCYEETTRSFCFTDTGLGSDQLIVDNQGNVLGAVHLVIKPKSSDVSISSSLSSSSPDYGDHFNVTVTVTNTGDFSVSDLHYEASLPLG